MAIAGGSITAWMGFAGLSDTSFVPPVADYPDKDDVRYPVSYASGTKTGTLRLPTIGVVLDGEGYGANGTELEGVYVCPAGGDEEEPLPTPPVVHTGDPGFFGFLQLLHIMPAAPRPPCQPGLGVLVRGRLLGSGRVVGRSSV